MTGFSSGPHTPIEAVTELGETIIQKLVTAGITTVEALADMTPEQLEEIPGIGEKTLERISVAVRHYFGQYEEGEVNPNAAAEEAKASEVDEPGTPDEPTEEATAELQPESDPAAASTETMEVENAADPERTHPVDEEDTVAISDAEATVSPEAVLEATEKAEEGAIDQVSEEFSGLGDTKGDA
jgi:N utilization substance protein A